MNVDVGCKDCDDHPVRPPVDSTGTVNVCAQPFIDQTFSCAGNDIWKKCCLTTRVDCDENDSGDGTVCTAFFDGGECKPGFFCFCDDDCHVPGGREVIPMEMAMEM